MKKIRLFVAVLFVMMSLTISAFAADSYAEWTSEWPFSEEGQYIGFSSGTANWTIYDGITMYYGLNKETNEAIYYDDYNVFVDGNFNEFVPMNWEPLDVNQNLPVLEPVIADINDYIGNWYVWKDEKNNFWLSYAVANTVFHIDNQKVIHSADFSIPSYEDEVAQMNQAESDAMNGVSHAYTPYTLREIIRNADIPSPGPNGGSASLIVGVIVVILVVACGAYFIRGRNRKTVAVGAENVNENAQAQEEANNKSNTERAAETAAKAANVANDVANKATDAAKTAAFMAKEKASEFSKAFKDAQARQRAEGKKFCPHCGGAVDEDAKFCGSCGADLQEDTTK
ncbi:zinc-ribbon domain-containing protein [Candidatus Agathobaculum pullicola]|uniref:zinc-ribbon domain-containing protein n=1 Tax=Candidatus Agathobaculum pullicola TaxID=2838426 RepID=UPI003F8FBA54